MAHTHFNDSRKALCALFELCRQFGSVRQTPEFALERLRGNFAQFRCDVSQFRLVHPFNVAIVDKIHLKLCNE